MKRELTKILDKVEAIPIYDFSRNASVLRNVVEDDECDEDVAYSIAYTIRCLYDDCYTKVGEKDNKTIIECATEVLETLCFILPNWETELYLNSFREQLTNDELKLLLENVAYAIRDNIIFD